MAVVVSGPPHVALPLVVAGALAGVAVEFASSSTLSIRTAGGSTSVKAAVAEVLGAKAADVRKPSFMLYRLLLDYHTYIIAGWRVAEYRV